LGTNDNTKIEKIPKLFTNSMIKASRLQQNYRNSRSLLKLIDENKIKK